MSLPSPFKKLISGMEALRPERVFVLLAIPFGLAILLLTPPFQMPDEQVHFFRAFQISEGHLREARQGHEFGGMLPSSLYELQHTFLGIRFQYNKKQDAGVLLSHLRRPLAAGQREFVPFTPAATYSPPLYFPQALGIAVARALGGGPLGLLYGGRFFNLLAYAAVVFLALRLMPIHRWVLAAIALMPMAMYQASATSVDAMANACSFLFFAAILALAIRPATHRAFSPWWIVFLAALAALCKGYPPLIALCLLVPVERLGTKRAYALWVAAVVLAYVAALGIWFWLVSGLSEPNDPGHVPLMTQLHLMASHPEKFLHTLWATWTCAEVVRGIAWTFVGCLGWLETPMPYWFIQLYGVLLLVTALLDAPAEPIRFALGRRLLVAGVAVLCVGLVSTVMYIAHTPVNGPDLVIGIQGRYFIPVAPLALAILVNRWGANLFPKLKAGIVAVFLFSAALTLVTLLRRFYG